MTRRQLLRLALSLPAGAWYSRYEALATPQRREVKIADIRAMNLRDRGTSLLKITTDSGKEAWKSKPKRRETTSRKYGTANWKCRRGPD